MRKLIAVALTLVLLLLCSCTNTGTTPQPTTPTEPETAGYMIIEEIDHCVVEPDDELHMSEEDKAHYKMLMEGMLDRESKIKLSDSKEQNAECMQNRSIRSSCFSKPDKSRHLDTEKEEIQAPYPLYGCGRMSFRVQLQRKRLRFCRECCRFHLRWSLQFSETYRR